MKNSLLLLLIMLSTSCKFLNRKVVEKRFNREIWLQHNSVEEHDNPRESMVKDVQRNHLKKGMKKEVIFNILGKPYEDGIKCKLPKGVAVPDSISAFNIGKWSKAEKKVKRKQFQQWFEENSQSENMVLYPIGWSIIDPRFLAIKFDHNQAAIDYWVEEH